MLADEDTGSGNQVHSFQTASATKGARQCCSVAAPGFVDGDLVLPGGGEGPEAQWFAATRTPFRDDAGRVAGYLGVALETTECIQTERARGEDALRESEARMRRAMEIETVGVIFFKAPGEITYANEAFLRMSGYTAADREAGLVRWDTMTPPEFMPQSERAIAEFQRHGRTTPYEKQYIRKDGSRWWALFFATRVSEDEGLEYIVDITQRREAEKALRGLAGPVRAEWLHAPVPRRAA